MDKKIIFLHGREGSFRLRPSHHDYYAARPDSLEHICFAQFVINYVPLPKNYQLKDDLNILSEGKIVSLNTSNETHLPIFIKLKNQQLGFMKLRMFPAILREHKFDKSKSPHEHYYSQILLYRPWREEKELAFDNFIDCATMFHSKSIQSEKSDIEIIQERLFPFKKKLANQEMSFCSLFDSVAIELDPENTFLNSESEEIGPKVDDDFSARSTDLLMVSNQETMANVSKYKKINFENIDLFLESARKLIPEQRCAFDKIIKFCKGIRHASSSSWPSPEPPLLVIHGGAGSGKTKLINDIAFWSEYFLRPLFPKNPEHPVVLCVAPTGKAASLISGMTLHSAFNLPFGNEDRSLSDQARERFRCELSNLKILIIDEISMVKSDLLYQLDSRLQDIKQSFCPFGGVSVLLFGDLMQLKPIQANWIFEQPRGAKFKLTHEVSPLWELFSFIELTSNHRQGQDKLYADMLNRLRFGDHTVGDIEKLELRMRNDYPPEPMFVFPTRKPVHQLNLSRLEELDQPLIELKALHEHPHQFAYKPIISHDGFVGNTPFLSTLKLKKGARIILTYNVNTSDGLSNGTTGTVVDFISECNNVNSVLILFDERDVGKQTRAQNLYIIQKFPDCTPINRISFEYNVGNSTKNHTAKAKVVQFPISLAWALTAHKCQGMTIKKPTCMVADLKHVFTAGQAYVMLGRIQDLSQLFLSSFSSKCIKVDAKARQQARIISDKAINKQPNWDKMSDKQNLNIISLNTRSLKKHFQDILHDNLFLKADIICLQETHLYDTDKTSMYTLAGFKSVFASKGKGAGVAMYVNSSIEVLVSETVVQKTFQSIKMSLRELDIIVIYQSPNYSNNALMSYLCSVLETDKNIVLCGDFNIPTQCSSKLTNLILQKGLSQMVSLPTHLDGNILDNFYLKTPTLTFLHYFLHSPYFSDHEAVCAVFQRPFFFL